MGKKSLLSGVCFSLSIAAFAFAQTGPGPTTITPPSSTDTLEPGANAGSPAFAAPDQGAATGAASSGGTSNTSPSTQPTAADHGSVTDAPASGKGTISGEGAAEKQQATPDHGSAIEVVPSGGAAEKQSGSESDHAGSSNVSSSRSDKAAGHSRSHAAPVSTLPPAESVHGHRHSPTAPHTPAPPSDENASAEQFLRDAQTALRKHHTNEAQEALERAETRVLEGAKGQGTSRDADQSRIIAAIEQAREALGHRRYLRPDVTQAGQSIDQALVQSTAGSATSVSDGPAQAGP